MGGPNIATKYLGNNDPTFKIRLSHNIKSKFRVSLNYYSLSSFAHLSIQTQEESEILSDTIRGIFLGSSTTKVHRIGFGAGYEFDFFKERIKLIPSIVFNSELAFDTDGGKIFELNGDRKI
jgi:hypothetical protein